MEVILLDRVRNLGGVGDRVNVRGGYGRNYLIPQGKATPASASNVAAFEERRAELEKAAAGALGTAQTRAQALSGVSISLIRNAGDEGKLFGSVTVRDVVEALAAEGHDVDRGDVNLPDGPIREVGTSIAEILLHADVVANIAVNVTTGQPGELEENDALDSDPVSDSALDLDNDQDTVWEAGENSPDDDDDDDDDEVAGVVESAE